METPKITFAPGCFDSLDVESQEELDSIVAQIQSMFEGKSADEIREMSQPLDLEAMFEEDPELAEALMSQLTDADMSNDGNSRRTLQ